MRERRERKRRKERKRKGKLGFASPNPGFVDFGVGLRKESLDCVLFGVFASFEAKGSLLNLRLVFP